MLVRYTGRREQSKQLHQFMGEQEMTRSRTTAREYGSRHVSFPPFLSYARGTRRQSSQSTCSAARTTRGLWTRYTDAPHNRTVSRFCGFQTNAKALTRGSGGTTWHSHATPDGSRRGKARDRFARPAHLTLSQYAGHVDGDADGFSCNIHLYASRSVPPCKCSGPTAREARLIPYDYRLAHDGR